MVHIPEFIAKGIEWHKNDDKIQFDSSPLFYTICKIPVFHGDTYWVYTNENKTSFNMVIANQKFDYNDGNERFKTKEQAQEAIKVFKWLNQVS